jgi:hypothetical protein
MQLEHCPLASSKQVMARLSKFWIFVCVCFSVCAGQAAPVPDKAFEQALLKALEPLQRKQLPHYVAGTEVVVQEFQDGKPYGPELKSVLKTYTPYYSGSDLMPEPLAETSNTLQVVKSCPSELQIDGHTVPTIVRTLSFNLWGPGFSGTRTTRQWLFAPNPKIVLRQEYVPTDAEDKCEQSNTVDWWAVTGSGIRKRIGDKEYDCVEVQDRNDFVGGYVVTTMYLSSQAPTFWVESVKEFYKIDKGQSKFSFIRTMRVMSIKAPSE